MDMPINILIVDDEAKNLTVLETILGGQDYRLVRAESADQALLALVVEEFALLILDIRMPGMTGIELARMIKERKKTARVPIIFLTAYLNEDQHVLAGYDTGAVDYLHKPVSRIRRGRIELRRGHVELAKVVTGAIETSRPLIDESGHELTLTMPPGDLIVDGDEVRLTQVFMNLLTNAAKYSEKGSRIDLRAQRQGSDVVVTVKDTGIGIPPAKLQTIFEMFSQVETALSRSRGGLGIGLCLVKQLVEMHGGSIEARSEWPGKGSEFAVRLPVAVEQTFLRGASDEGTADLVSQLRVLVVDDNRDAASSLAMLLKVMGNDVRTAHDGEEAVRSADEFRPDVVLCDIGLPKMNGYEVARAIREGAWGKRMALIAVTGWGQDEDRRKSAEAGFDRHLVKPVDPQALMKLLAGLDVVKVRPVKPIPQT